MKIKIIDIKRPHNNDQYYMITIDEEIYHGMVSHLPSMEVLEKIVEDRIGNWGQNFKQSIKNGQIIYW